MSAWVIPLREPCRIWTGRLHNEGYGKAGDEYVHRISYEAAFGPIPDGMHIDHVCRNRACWEPTHLEVVTPRENLIRGNGPSGLNHRKTRCLNGHQLSGANLKLVWEKDGRKYPKRFCLECGRERARRYRARTNTRVGA